MTDKWFCFEGDILNPTVYGANYPKHGMTFVAKPKDLSNVLAQKICAELQSLVERGYPIEETTSYYAKKVIDANGHSIAENPSNVILTKCLQIQIHNPTNGACEEEWGVCFPVDYEVEDIQKFDISSLSSEAQTLFLNDPRNQASLLKFRQGFFIYHAFPNTPNKPASYTSAMAKRGKKHNISITASMMGTIVDFTIRLYNRQLLGI